MKFRHVPIGILIAALAYWAGVKSSRDPASPGGEDNPYKIAVSNLEQKIQAIADVDLAEYRRLKDRKLQAEKAEEILAKILQIFIADLGLRLAHSDLGPMVKHDRPTENAPGLVAGHEGAKGRNSGQDKQTNPPASESSVDWKKLEESLPKVNSSREQDEFLKAVSQENFFPTVRGAVPAQRRNLEQLRGTHKGQLVFLDRGRKTKDFELQIELDSDFNKTSGTYSIIISQDGVKESHTSGSGDFRHFFSSGESSAVIIRSTPSSYVQLYHSSPLGQFFGNSYNQESVDKFVLEGHVYLR